MITVENNGSKIVYWGRDKSRELYEKEVNDFIPYFFYENLDGEYEGLFGDRLSKMEVSIPSDVPDLRANYKHHEADIIYINRFIIDRIDRIEEQPIRKAYLDIETEMKRGDDIAAGLAIIKLIGVHDSFNSKYCQFFLPDYESESAMLQDFVKYIKIKDPDMIIEWSLGGFDIPALINRMRVLKINYKDLARNGLSYVKKYGNEYRIKIGGRIFFNLMGGYKKLTVTHSGKRESYALDFIAKYELGEGKEEYEGNLDELYIDNPEKYKSYNKRDVELLVLLDNKLNITEYFDNIRRLAFCGFDDVFMNSKVIDCAILKKVHNKFVLPSKHHREKEKKKGGAVRKPKQGLYSDVAVLDLRGIYPAIVESCNISPETYVESNVGNDCVNVFNQYYFLKSKKGIIPEIVEEWGILRDKYKRLMRESPYGSIEYKKYDNQQYAVKQLRNSVFGFLGFVGSRLYKKECFEAITLIPRKLIEYSIEFVERKGFSVIYSDTDSIFLARKGMTVDDVKILTGELNKSYDEFVKQLNITSHKIEMEFDEMFETILFKEGTKKKYAGKLKWKGGKPNNDIIVKGFEVRRSDSPQVIRDLQKKVFEMIFDKKSKKEIEEHVNNFKLKFMTMREEIGIPTTLNKPLESYENAIHATAARESNRLHDTNFRQGSKFKYIYVANGTKHVIAFEKKLPVEYKVNYRAMEERLFNNIEEILACLEGKRQRGLGEF